MPGLPAESFTSTVVSPPYIEPLAGSAHAGPAAPHCRIGLVAWAPERADAAVAWWLGQPEPGILVWRRPPAAPTPPHPPNTRPRGYRLSMQKRFRYSAGFPVPQVQATIAVMAPCTRAGPAAGSPVPDLVAVCSSACRSRPAAGAAERRPGNQARAPPTVRRQHPSRRQQGRGLVAGEPVLPAAPGAAGRPGADRARHQNPGGRVR